MHYPLSRFFPTCLLLALLLLWLTATLQAAELPDRFGQVVYQSNPAAKKKVYIIANAHRSARTGNNNQATVQAQIETYRIGEWLYTRNNLDLLLPEGFFGHKPGEKIQPASGLFDCGQLTERLSDTAKFTNAERLLHERFGLGLQQVEDRQLYQDIRNQLSQAYRPENLLSREFRQQVTALQKRRTAVILQNIPQALQSFSSDSVTAMMTIGLSHLQDLVSFLENEQVLLADQQNHSTWTADKEDIGVTVIVPRSLLSMLPDNGQNKS